MNDDWDGVQKAGIVLAIILFLGAAWHVFSNMQTCLETCEYVDREFIPAHTDHWTTMECVMHDPKTGGCSVHVPVHHSNFVPDAWYLTWKDFKSSQHTLQVGKDYFDNHPQTETHEHWRWKQCVSGGGSGTF